MAFLVFSYPNNSGAVGPGGAYSANAYGADGYHQYMRTYDPSYDAFFPEGPSVDDKWRSTYPYVPTAYSYNSDGKSKEAIGSWHYMAQDTTLRPTSLLLLLKV